MNEVSLLKQFSFECFIVAMIVWTAGFFAVIFWKKIFSDNGIRQFLTRFSWLSSPWVLVVVFGGLYSLLAIARHWSLQSHAFDLGIFTQMMYNYAHFNGLYNSIRGLNILGDHFHPTLMLLTPGWWLLPRAESLLIVQAFVVSLGAVPVYLLTYRRFGRRFLAWSLALVFVLAPGLQQAVGFDFHEITLTATGLMFVAYFAFNRQWGSYWFVFVLILGLKENAPLYLAAWSFYLLCRTWQWKQALWGMGTALIYFAIVTFAVVPALRGAQSSGYEYFDFPQFGSTPSQAVIRVISDPFHTLDVFQNPEVKQETRSVLLAGFGWLPLLGPLAWIAAAPMLAEQFLFEVPSHWTLQFHYGAAITAPLVLAALDAFSLIIFCKKRIPVIGDLRLNHFFGIVSLFMIFSLISLTTQQNSFFVHLWQGTFFHPSAEIFQTRALLRQIPADASVVASHALVPHLAARRDIIAWPPQRPEPGLHDLHAEYAVFHLHGSFWPLQSQQDQISLLETFIARPDYGLVESSAGAVLLKRGVEDKEEVLQEWRDYLSGI